MALIFALCGQNAGAWIPAVEGVLNAPDDGLLRLAAADEVPEKRKKKSKSDSKFSEEEFRKRGAELGNFVYEVFDPNAKDPLADLDLDFPGEKKSNPKFWWIAGGAAALVGAGVAGYFLIAPGPDIIKIRYLDFCDSEPCRP